ncbi:Peptidase M23 [Solidesulfovibrio fructosivorans JJ]]|uniref:Peptidase M23 n=1 Tax=Solidesulfovibrio fructosivorans JJ] TaxID=596151 RepID=E1K1F3_SOLFR|nr:M23 family metallopeptidase [Solidesulfovibrio fructosivorans]EFL49568.1 Peptidase M23 [Solidesulfovibrio fructosivorans JJ]]
MRIIKPFKGRRGFGPVFFLLAAALVLAPVAAAGFAGYYLFLKDAHKPELVLLPEANASSLRRPFTVTAADPQSGIRSITVTVTQGQRRNTILHKSYDPPRDKVSESFNLENSELRGGAFELQAAAYDGSYANLGAGNTARVSRRMLLDLVAPSVKALTPAHYVRQGGVGLVVYEVNKDAVRSGVVVGDRFYPGFRQPGGQYACLFAFPSDMDANAFKPRLFVEDAAGNERTGFFVNMAIKRRFRDERVDVSDAYLAAHLPAFAALYPEIRDPVARFQKINDDLRRQNEAVPAALSKESPHEPLWDGAFIYMPRSIVRGSFGADRVYVHDGREIGREKSAGIDLASVPHAPVPAANNGKVVYAGPLGVFGDTVIIDHGMGLLSLYGNLSSIAVRKGESVKKGAVIGATGTTGLAANDQVHFAMYLDGQPVIPIEWWDGHWLEDNVTAKLRRYAPAPEGASGKTASAPRS